MNLPSLETCQRQLPSCEFGAKNRLLSDLGQSATPKAVLLTCWELGFAPEQVSHAVPGEIMVVQNPGGLVGDEKSSNAQVGLASVMYGLSCPTVRHLIVCGHSHCKTLVSLLSNDDASNLAPSNDLLTRVSRRFEALYARRPTKDWLRIVAQETVLEQLAALRTNASIQTRLKEGTLLLHAWLRDDETSVITEYDPTVGQFSD